MTKKLFWASWVGHDIKANIVVGSCRFNLQSPDVKLILLEVSKAVELVYAMWKAKMHYMFYFLC